MQTQVIDTILVSDRSDRENLEWLKREPALTCIVPLRSEHREGDAEAARRALDLRRGANAGSIVLADHDARTERARFELKNSAERHHFIAAFGAAARAAACFRDFGTVCETTASELLTNAFYNAPLDDRGRPRVHDRRVAVLLENPIEAAFGEDEQTMWLDVRDPFGTLTRETLLGALLRSSDGEGLEANLGEGGAGIGIYMVFRNSTRVLFHLEPGRATRVLCKILKTKRQRAFDDQRAILEILLA